MYKDENPNLIFTQRERVESNENKEATLKFEPIGKIFAYDAATGCKLENVEYIGDKKIKIENSYQDIIIDYDYNYLGNTTQVKLG